LVKLAQVRRGYHDGTHRLRLLVTLQRGRDHRLGGPAAHPHQDRLDVEAGWASAHLDDPLHRLDGVLVEQGQDAREVLDAPIRAVLFRQGLAKLAEDGRQVPAAKDVGVIERCRSVRQGPQVVMRVENVLVVGIRPRMRGDHLTAQHHIDVVHIGFDGDGLERR